MSNANYPNHTALARTLNSYLRWRNTHARHPECSQAMLLSPHQCHSPRLPLLFRSP